MAEVVHSLECVLALQKKTNLLQSTGKTIFARMIDKFSVTNKVQNSGVEDIQRDWKTDKVVVKGEKADPSKILERIQKKSHRQPISTPKKNQKKDNELLFVAPKPPADEPKDEKKETPKHEEIRKWTHGMIVEENVEQDIKSSQATVEGTYEAPQLVDYFHKRTEKKSVIVNQEPEPKEEGYKGKEDKTNDVGEKKEEKKAKAVADGGGGNGKEKEKDVGDESEEETLHFRSSSDDSEEEEEGRLYLPSSSDESEEDMKVVKPNMNEHYNYYKHYYTPLNYQSYPQGYTAESAYYTTAPQMFSDDNPNSCSVM